MDITYIHIIIYMCGFVMSKKGWYPQSKAIFIEDMMMTP